MNISGTVGHKICDAIGYARIDVKLRLVRITIIAMEKQYYIF